MPYISVDFWWVRIFDFPHLQLTLLTALAIATYIIKFDFKDYRDYVFISALIACFIFQFIKIYPYTTFAKYEVLNATNPVKKQFSVFTANVLQENENTDMVMKEIDTMAMLYYLQKLTIGGSKQLTKIFRTIIGIAFNTL